MTQILDILKDLDLLKYSKQRFIKNSEIYVSSGTLYKEIFYIKKGILRSFHLTELDEEKTISILSEGDVAVIPECVFNNKPSSLTWQALEDCELLEFDFELFNELSKDNIFLLKTRLEFAEKLLDQTTERLECFILDKPSIRYQKFIMHKQELFHRVSDKHIASYIGVTPVSLSRIRKRLANSAQKI